MSFVIRLIWDSAAVFGLADVLLLVERAREYIADYDRRMRGQRHGQRRG